nr:MAG TPA: TFIIB-TERMINAL DOMAIN, TFIIB, TRANSCRIPTION INITIATION [Caudoviricetes sp.]
MMKKLMSLGLVGILSASLMVGCSSNDSKDDDTVTIKYVDENGNVVKKDHVTRKEAKEIERKQQSNDTTKKEQPKKEQPSKQHKDTTTKDDRNLDDQLYGNAARGTCPDCGRTAMVFNNGAGLKCAYCGFYDDGYFLDDEEPDPSYSDNKEDDYTPEDNSEDDYDYDEQQEQDDYNDYEDQESIENNNDVEESPSEPAQ